MAIERTTGSLKENFGVLDLRIIFVGVDLLSGRLLESGEDSRVRIFDRGGVDVVVVTKED